jgi:SAM-dependent methyltransferase
MRVNLDTTALRKLFRLVFSPQHRYVRRVARDVQAKIPKSEFERIREKYLVEDPGIEGSYIVHTGTRKYLDAPAWIENAVERAVAEGLHTSKPLSILDLGCGVPYFLLVARHFGHDVVGLDLDDNRMFNELTRLFQIQRYEHRIVPLGPLPEFGRKFDLITSYMTFFYYYHSEGPARSWSADEWSFFFQEIRRVLAPGGVLRVHLNPGGSYLPPDERGAYLKKETASKLREFPGVKVSDPPRTITLEA